MTYTVEFKKSAAKALQKLPKNIQRRIADAIDALAFDPRPHGYIQMESEEIFYRIRVGDYRIIYEIFNEKLIVLVVRIGHRGDVYKR